MNTADIAWVCTAVAAIAAVSAVLVMHITGTRKGYRWALSASYGPGPQPKPSPVTPQVPAQRESADGGRF